VGWVDSVGMSSWPVQDVQSICVCLTGLILESDHHVSVESTEYGVRSTCTEKNELCPTSIRTKYSVEYENYYVRRALE
jgi:hypothetical protein